MAHKYTQIAFTNTVKEFQTEQNSRRSYVPMEEGEDYNYLLSDNEANFIGARDSFYMASVSETQWPYVQHRGGPPGFMRVLDASTIGFADFSGNRQYVSAGNFRTNDRVALFFMDYPNRRRLKLMGRIKQLDNSDWELLAKLELDDYRASVERGFIIQIEAFDWNCPKHITPKFSEREIETLIAPIREENIRLKAQVTNQATGINKPWGEGELPLVVSAVRQLTPRVRAYELRHKDGADLPKVNAGAHIQLPLIQADGKKITRHYSICSNPMRRDIYEIAVLNDAKGRGGSQLVHESLQLGQRLNCNLADNYFSLHDDSRPAVLIAGGIGITPIKAMAQTLHARGTEFSLHYAGRSLSEMAFQDRMHRSFPDEITFYSADNSKRLDIAALIKTADTDAIFYVCGPNSLIDDLVQAAKNLGVDSSRIRYERFKSNQQEQQQEQQKIEAKPITVTLSKSNKTIQVAKDESVLDALLECGIEIAHSCKMGECRSCVVKVVQGEPVHLDNCLSDDERSKQKLMCPCVSRSQGESLHIDI
ncbi:MAG: ferredoxin-NADP reductase [Flavobacteriales bacterium]|jgi:ferredoxin-NADP reductase/predicted pyridoxine 5'-phosphate oxidase superfamily flavin-nucleotide-binding protein